MSSIGDFLHLTVCSCSQMQQGLPTRDQRACPKHVSHVWPAETNPPTSTFSRTIMRRNFRRVWPLLRHLVSPLWGREKRGSRGWKELRLCPSEPVLATETTGKLMWHSVLQPARAAGKGEWALSFFRVRVEKASTDSVNGVYSWGVNDLRWRRQCERSSSLPYWVQTVGWQSGLQQTQRIFFVAQYNDNT